MKTLKKMYNLSYDSSGFNSGLINWYNQVIDKTYSGLTVTDVCRMIRQDILKDIAIKKAIEFFLNDPYDGEYSDGGLLEILNSLDIYSQGVPDIDNLKTTLNYVKHDYINFEWSDEETKRQYAKNIGKMLKNLENT